MVSIGEDIRDWQLVTTPVITNITFSRVYSYSYVGGKIDDLELSLDFTKEDLVNIKKMFVSISEDGKDLEFRIMCLEQLIKARDIIFSINSPVDPETKKQLIKAKTLVYSAYPCALRNFLEIKLNELMKQPVDFIVPNLNEKLNVLEKFNCSTSADDICELLIELGNKEFINLGRDLRMLISKKILINLPFRNLLELQKELERLISYYDNLLTKIQTTNDGKEWIRLYNTLFEGLNICEVSSVVNVFLKLERSKKLTFYELKNLLNDLLHLGHYSNTVDSRIVEKSNIGIII
ncbi:hypothetical protein ACFW35_02470 [Fictibacillus sp. NPDC058756]|uniref:hypothetical protein n=1 Tax=Fictibacillus sp. NPDC058756 TaxID=3346625 RepID=UPI0036A81A94